MIKLKINLNLSKEFAKLAKAEKQKKIDKLVSALKDATPVDTGNARDSWKATGNTITNDAEYIDRLNAGTSTQAPAYFIEKTLLSQTGVRPVGTITRSK